MNPQASESCMVGKALKLGGKASIWLAKRQARKHGMKINLALGVLGAGIAACEAWKTHQHDAAVRGKVVLITGGSRGLGLELARQFGLGGAHLVLVARRDEELREALGTLMREGAIPNGSTAHTITADISLKEDCERMIADATERYGRVDILINCAGIITIGPFEDQPAEAFRDAMNINFFGQLYAIQAVLPQMLTRKSGQIVNIASIGGKIAVPHMLPYVASKFALVGLSEGLHAELRHKGIHVLTVCPGLMRTGSHVQVDLVGNAEKEYRWFKLAATVPGIAIAARSAAKSIFQATVARRAEITITPQAWLAARLVGIAPECSTRFAALANHIALPASNGNQQPVKGAEIEAKRKAQRTTRNNSNAGTPFSPAPA
ncbi:SDR family NAD(P)-dependent oxidoreductase [Terriglobus sp. RCC_193]|uniref:SDR family NAD(P)-dependent oxidoreductase n=1 Tax=Terriglobus sp. RCC_193 TaxID=3239218 RepID=UPI00352341F3